MSRENAGEPRPRLPVTPLAPAALGAMAGIVADRYVPFGMTRIWAASAILSAMVALAIRRPRWAARFCVTLAFAALGGGWHHYWWSDLASDDLARADWSSPRPAWVRGWIFDTPEFRADDGFSHEGSTKVILDVSGLSDGRRWHSASGRLLVTISGRLAGLDAGDPVEAAGSLGVFSGPLNPGEVDGRDRWRAQLIRLHLSIDSPKGMWRDPDGVVSSWLSWKGFLRERSRERLVSGLDPDVAPLASALLLGRRDDVDPDVNDAFARTGTTHLLAISGLHLQVLAGGLLGLFPILGMGRKPTASTVIVLTIAYAGLVGFMPSVVRSAVMTVAYSLATLRDRRARVGNILALSALATLAWNPCDLFDVGCQLSFLGVASVVWCMPAAQRLFQRTPHPLDEVERYYEPKWRRVPRAIGEYFTAIVLGSIVVWLVGLPLVALRFHLASPVAILLNVPLIPITSVALVAAALSLVLSFIWAPLAIPTSWVCEKLLKLTEFIVRWGSSRSWGHVFVAGPPWPWVIGFYLFLCSAMLSLATHRFRRTTCGLLGIWTVLGLGIVFGPAPRPERLEADILAVDHGLAVLVRSPSSQTLLYDCGRMGSPRVGRRLIAPALWERGVRRIDRVAISHADSDHYNGLPDLLDRFAIGEVVIPPGFGGLKNPEAARLLELIRNRGVPVREVVAGNRLDLGAGDEVEVLHPPKDWLPSAADNDHSLVLDVSSRGRHLLLTGDLDGAGLAEVWNLPPRPIDVMLSPHHGGRSANPAWLYDWAKPRVVAVSQRPPAPGSSDALAPLERRGLPVARTWKEGALALGWYDTKLAVSGFLAGIDRPEEARLGPADADQEAFMNGVPIPIASLGPSLLFSIVGLALGLCLCASMAIIEWGAWALVRPGRRLAMHDPEPPPWEPFSLSAADDARLAGAWLESEGADGRTAILLHGFAEDRIALLGRALALHSRGWNVALIDARGRGRSEGDVCSFGAREADDLRLWVAALSDRVGPSLKLLVWGRSMGAAIALRAAADEPRIGALVLEAPYPDLAITVSAWLRRSRLPGFFARPILRRAQSLAGVSLERPRPIDVAPRVRTPTLIVHGSSDPIVPLSEARHLAGAFPEPAVLIEVDGARHADVFDHGGPGLVDRLVAFADRARKGCASPSEAAAERT